MRIEFRAKYLQKKFLSEFAGFFGICIPEIGIRRQFMFFIENPGLDDQRILIWKDEKIYINIHGCDCGSKLEHEKHALFHIFKKLLLREVIEIIDSIKKSTEYVQMQKTGSESALPKNFVDLDQIFEIYTTTKSEKPHFQLFLSTSCL